MLLSFICLLLGAAHGANLLTNPGFESGQTGWSGVVRGSIATVITNATVAHAGNSCISNYNAGGWSSASQGDSRGGWSTGVTIPVSDAKFYKLSAYVKVPGASSVPADITLRYRFEPSGNRVDVGQQTVATEGWTLLESGWVAPTAGDTYMSYWEVHSVANAVVFYADDCSLEESDGATISGLVKDGSGTAVVGAQVQLKLTGTVVKTTTTTAGGAYTFHVEPVAGTAYTLNASKLNYSSPATDVDVTTVAPPGVATAADIVLTALPTVIVSGGVTNGATGQAVAGATVTVLGASGSQTTTTDSNGRYSFVVASGDSYYVTARKLPLSAPTQYISPSANQTLDFTLTSSLLVGIYAENLTAGSLGTWANAGTLGGEFRPLSATLPVAGQSGFYRSVSFNNSPMILTNGTAGTPVTAPPEITGASASYTVNAWLFEPDSTLPDQQTYVSWAKRGGPDGSNCEMGYGVNGSYGAVGHWGAPDMGFTTPPTGGTWHNLIVTWDYMSGIESIYIDGVLSKNSPVKSLDIGAGLPIVLGAGYWIDGTTGALSTDIALSASLAQLEIFSAPATADDVARMITNNVPVLHATATIQGHVVTTDSSVPSGFTVTLTDNGGAFVGQAVSGNDGSYSVIVSPGTYTAKAIKAGYVTMPAPQTRTVVAGDTATLTAFTATPSTVSGKLVDATTGAAIYNGVVQVGGKGGQAMITDQTGTYSLPATGCGGVELFADALNYHCRNLLLTNVGGLSKKIALTAEVETGVITNGGFEDVAGGLPNSWIQGWDVPASPVAITEFWATNVPSSGTNSAFVTGAAAFEPLSQFIPSDPSSVYNCYFKAVGTNMGSAGAVWFPMFAFRGGDFGEMKGWISGEAAPYEGWSHTAPTGWMQYLLFHTYSGDATQPFIRVAPPAGAVWLSATFCFTGSALTSDQGVFVDDVVMDRVPATVPLETVASDPATVSLAVERVGSGIRLIWEQGTLLEAPTVTGPWTTNSATSPFTNSAPVGNKFYKLIVQ
ncbi:MAG TPA: carboxypeptidase regulatory-like domain-containing protein [Candidatus Paceibacterota bacterium]|nr:carboxypeptidase regulatory-like domain-containing protein [Candidatus Paceibacterota bacterium]